MHKTFSKIDKVGQIEVPYRGANGPVDLMQMSVGRVCDPNRT